MATERIDSSVWPSDHRRALSGRRHGSDAFPRIRARGVRFDHREVAPELSPPDRINTSIRTCDCAQLKAWILHGSNRCPCAGANPNYWALIEPRGDLNVDLIG